MRGCHVHIIPYTVVAHHATHQFVYTMLSMRTTTVVTTAYTIPQTYQFVCSMLEEHCTHFNKMTMDIWEALELLNEVVDDSDPDTAFPQIEHLLQTAEAIRAAYPDVRSGCVVILHVCIYTLVLNTHVHSIHTHTPQKDDWFHLTGLLHDLGKVLAHPAFGSQPQWAVVGDTFPVGCAHAPCIVYPHLFANNPDTHDPR